MKHRDGMGSRRVAGALAAGLMMSAGCGPRPESSDVAPDPYAEAGAAGVIGLSVLTLTNPFFKDIADHVTQAAGTHGYEVLVVSSDQDPARQNDQVNDFIARRVSAIFLNPADSKAIGEPIKQANRAGIPVFTCDIACLAPDAKVVAHVATDNYGGGRMAAEAMMEALGNQGQVAIIDHPEVESVIQRTKGFRDALTEANSPIQIVQAVPGRGAKSESFTAAQELLQAHPELAGIFAINDPSALGAYAALVKAGRQDRVTLVGFDGMPEGRQAIKDGKIYADAMQSTQAIAQGVVDAFIRYLDGEAVDPEILIPTELYKKADAERDPTLR